MSTREQIRDAVRVLIDQTSVSSSRFTNPELNTLINESQDFVGASIGHPRDLISVVTQQSVGAYTLPSDNLFIKQAGFGNPAINGDVKELEIVSTKALWSLFPNWLETTSQADGRPTHLIILDKRTVFIFKRPNSN